MNGGAQAFRQPVKADRWFEPPAVIDAFHVIQNIAVVEHGARFTKSKRLHFLGGLRLSCCTGAFVAAACGLCIYSSVELQNGRCCLAAASGERYI